MPRKASAVGAERGEMRARQEAEGDEESGSCQRRKEWLNEEATKREDAIAFAGVVLQT